MPNVEEKLTLLTRVINRLTRQIGGIATGDKEIWDAQDCADYLKCTRKHFSDRISNNHGFPQPLRMPSPEGKNPHRRWYAKEVIQWAENLR